MGYEPILTYKFKSVFISDVHLGTRGSQASSLVDFIKIIDADSIYLVGDIVDFWKIRRGPLWPQSHNDVVQKLLRKVRKGAQIIFIPGNHDEALRDFCGHNFGGIQILRDTIHTCVDGKKFKVMHGDEFDVVVRYAKWLAFLGDRSYRFLLYLNTPLNWVRRHLGLGYWSLSGYLKNRVKTAVNFIGEFEMSLVDHAKSENVDGIICGHVHNPSDKMIEGIRYINCGDWVESCTAIVETHSGEFHLIRWNETVGGIQNKHFMQSILVNTDLINSTSRRMETV